MDSIRIAIASLEQAIHPAPPAPPPPLAPEARGPRHPDRTEYSWAGDHRHNGERSEDVDRLIAGRDRIEVLGGWASDDDCGYDAAALVRLDGDYFALTTSGCSCPDPSETWQIDFGPATLAELQAWVEKGPRAVELRPYLGPVPWALELVVPTGPVERGIFRIFLAAAGEALPIAVWKRGDGSYLCTIDRAPVADFDAHCMAIWADFRLRAAAAGVELPAESSA